MRSEAAKPWDGLLAAASHRFSRRMHLFGVRSRAASTSVTLTDDQFRAISRALADAHRFAILQQVAANDGMACSSLEQHAVLSPATVSHHMKELSEAGLIELQREGRCANLFLCRGVLDAYVLRLAAL